MWSFFFFTSFTDWVLVFFSSFSHGPGSFVLCLPPPPSTTI
uniref:Uncharacterized protein n=1 Tax=Phakopsora pachyrhizi TaxID=170000 RepID=A0A0S1MJX8_PHAPC